MISRPAAPVSETPRIDEFKRRLMDALYDSPKSRESQWEEAARELERELRQAEIGEFQEHERAENAATALSLAQTEIKGHMRVEDELKAEITKLGKPEICDVCLNEPLPSGRECICGGFGTLAAALTGTRQALYDAKKNAQARIAELERVLARTLSWLSSYPGGGALGAYDEARAALKDRA